MEQILKLIYFVLNSSSDVTNITSRLYPVVAPENTSFPCVVYWVSGVSPSDTKSGASSVDNMFVTIDSYAANTATSSGYTVVSNLAGHIRTALDRLPSSTYNTITIDGAQFIDAEIGYDAESDVYVVSMDFKFRVNRLGASIPVNAVPPILSGIEIIGNTLSVTNGTWNVSGLTFTYQWLRNGIAIAGATENTYTLVNDDYNAVISCQVTADNEGVVATATSNETDPIGGIVPAITELPTIAGIVQVGETLTATASAATGFPTPVTSWQWQTSPDGNAWSDISAAVSNTYTLLAADYDQYIRVVQTETNGEGSASANSVATTQVAGTIPVISEVPTFSGTEQVGETLTAVAASVTGVPTPSTTWQWQYSDDGATNWQNISGATSISYTIDNAYYDKYLRVVQTETNAEGADTAESVASGAIAGIIPVISGVPTIAGTVEIGETLTATEATVAGVPAPSTTWQWQISDDGLTGWSNIAGETANSYTILEGNYDKYLRVIQTETNAEGADTATSAATVQVPGTVPVISESPTIAGTVQVLETLTATAGAVTGIPTPSTTWQWQISDDGATGWADITGETGNTYTIDAADYDKYLRVIQTETNAEGSDTATSAATVQIEGTVPVISGVPTISGVVDVGEVLTALAAPVTGIPTPSTSWQWQTSPDNSSWSDISGATSSTYTIQAGDAGNYLRVEQTETNAEGIDDAVSTATTQVPIQLFLDTFTNAKVAYSLRHLKTGITDVIKVREDGSNNEQDFTPTEITDGTLASFCGANNGFIVEWFDQSGNANHLTQSTAANQPKIYDSSTGLVTLNGEPAVEFPLSTTTMVPTTTSPLSLYTVMYVMEWTSGLRLLISSFRIDSSNTHSRYYAAGGDSGNYTYPTSPTVGQYLEFLHLSPPTGVYIYDVNFYRNNEGANENPGGANSILNGITGFTGTAGASVIGKFQELIIYETDKSSDRLAMQTDINGHYNIY